MIFASCNTGTNPFGEKTEKLKNAFYGTFESTKKNAKGYFRILKAKVFDRAEKGSKKVSTEAVLKDDGITYALKCDIFKATDKNKGTLSATGYSNDGNRRIQLTASVDKDNNFSNPKVRIAIKQGNKWVIKKTNGSTQKKAEQKGVEYKDPQFNNEAGYLPASMQGSWTMKVPGISGNEMNMTMYYKYVEASDGMPEGLVMCMPNGMGDMGGMNGATPPANGAGAGTPPATPPANGGTSATPPANGGTMPTMGGGKAPKDAQFKWVVKMPSEITFVITGSSLEPVFPDLTPELTVVKDAKLNAKCDLNKANELFKAMNPAPENENIKPMDILAVTRVDDNTYTAVIAQTLEMPKMDGLSEKEKKEFELPKELQDFSKDGFSLTAYQKVKFTLKDGKLELKNYEVMSMKPGATPKPEEMQKALANQFNYEYVSKLGDDKLSSQGETFEKIK